MDLEGRDRKDRRRVVLAQLGMARARTYLVDVARANLDEARELAGVMARAGVPAELARRSAVAWETRLQDARRDHDLELRALEERAAALAPA